MCYMYSRIIGSFCMSVFHNNFVVSFYFSSSKNILKLSLISAQPPSSGSPHMVQPSSLPSSVSETLEAMVGTSLDDLSLDDLVNTTIQDAAETPEVEVVHRVSY